MTIFQSRNPESQKSNLGVFKIYSLELHRWQLIGEWLWYLIKCVKFLYLNVHRFFCKWFSKCSLIQPKDIEMGQDSWKLKIRLYGPLKGSRDSCEVLLSWREQRVVGCQDRGGTEADRRCYIILWPKWKRDDMATVWTGETRGQNFSIKLQTLSMTYTSCSKYKKLLWP